MSIARDVLRSFNAPPCQSSVCRFAIRSPRFPAEVRRNLVCWLCSGLHGERDNLVEPEASGMGRTAFQ
jgi:hypothetical protein